MLTGRPQAAEAGRRAWAGWAASLLLALAAVARLLEHYAGAPRWAAAAGLLGAFLILLLATPLAARRSPALTHLCIALQAAVAVGLLLVPPPADFSTALLVALALQAALAVSRRALAVWTAVLALLTIVPAMFVLGWVRGLALELIPATACVILPAFVVAYQQVERARLESQRLLDELQAAQRRLQAYAAQAEELAAMEARNRLARELHDSVSQTLFSLSLNARAARLYLERDPGRLRPQLERLQALAQAALSEIRGLLEHLRPAGNSPSPS